jgi:hypothetical protein
MAFCPWGATCDTPDPTSVWLCGFDTSGDDATLTNCSAFGLSPENIDFSLNAKNDLTGGVAYDLLPQNGRSTPMSLSCDTSFPRGLINILTSAELVANGHQLNIAARTCGSLATPVSLTGECALSVLQGTPAWRLELDLARYGARASNTTVPPETLSDTSQLLFLPCGAIAWADRYDCRGDENAAMWL